MISEIKDGILFFDGCNTVELAEKYGTPLYVFSQTDIMNRFDELKKCFVDKYPGARVAYASKAFCTLAMCKLVEKAGMCMDVVSGGELYTAIKAGFPAERIEFNGNNKQPAELELAVDYGIGRIIIDSLQELPLIEKVCREKKKTMKVLYRITPGVKIDSHDYIVTGKKDSKFGLPIDDEVIMPAVEAAINSEYVDFLGFHFHIGSQIFDNQYHLQALESMLETVKRVKERFGYDVTELNLGGGFGAHYTDEKRQSYAYFLEPMMARINEFYNELGVKAPAVVVEPGRSIVAESGISLYKIGSIKDIKGVRKYVAVDGGMTDNIRPALYQAKYEAVVADKAAAEKTDTVTVCGKCCESGDILIKDIKLPVVEAGDILALFSTGAYGYAMASNYNKNAIPAVVLACKGSDELIVKRQSYESMISNELVPESLK